MNQARLRKKYNMPTPGHVGASIATRIAPAPENKEGGESAEAPLNQIESNTGANIAPGPEPTL